MLGPSDLPAGSTSTSGRKPGARTAIGGLLAAGAVLAACGFPQPSPPPTVSGSLPPPSAPSPSPSPVPTPSPSSTPFPVDCTPLPPDLCHRILAAALEALGAREQPVAAWFGRPIEEHYPVTSPDFRGTVIFQLPSGAYRLVVVNYVAGAGIGAFRYDASIPPWYPLPTSTAGD